MSMNTRITLHDYVLSFLNIEMESVLLLWIKTLSLSIAFLSARKVPSVQTGSLVLLLPCMATC